MALTWFEEGTAVISIPQTAIINRLSDEHHKNGHLGAIMVFNEQIQHISGIYFLTNWYFSYLPLFEILLF